MRFAAILISCFLALPAAAEKLSLNQISEFLNDLKTAEGAFTQINDDGSISTGRILIKRPGKMRFEYDPPEGTLVIAAANAVVIYDKKSNEPPEQYALKRTPLSLILARNIDLGRARMVIGHDFDGTATVVTAQDPDNPEFGYIRMMFTGEPVELRQWVINDGNGIETTIVLGELKRGVRINNTLFQTEGLGQSDR